MTEQNNNTIVKDNSKENEKIDKEREEVMKKLKILCGYTYILDKYDMDFITSKKLIISSPLKYRKANVPRSGIVSKLFMQGNKYSGLRFSIKDVSTDRWGVTKEIDDDKSKARQSSLNSDLLKLGAIVFHERYGIAPEDIDKQKVYKENSYVINLEIQGPEKCIKDENTQKLFFEKQIPHEYYDPLSNLDKRILELCEENEKKYEKYYNRVIAGGDSNEQPKVGEVSARQRWLAAGGRVKPMTFEEIKKAYLPIIQRPTTINKDTEKITMYYTEKMKVKFYTSPPGELNPYSVRITKFNPKTQNFIYEKERKYMEHGVVKTSTGPITIDEFLNKQAEVKVITIKLNDIWFLKTKRGGVMFGITPRTEEICFTKREIVSRGKGFSESLKKFGIDPDKKELEVEDLTQKKDEIHDNQQQQNYNQNNYQNQNYAQQQPQQQQNYQNQNYAQQQQNYQNQNYAQQQPQQQQNYQNYAQPQPQQQNYQNKFVEKNNQINQFGSNQQPQKPILPPPPQQQQAPEEKKKLESEKFFDGLLQKSIDSATEKNKAEFGNIKINPTIEEKNELINTKIMPKLDPSKDSKKRKRNDKDDKDDEEPQKKKRRRKKEEDEEE